MSIFDEPKIDCHTHILDPVSFPYTPDTHYRPAGQENGTAAQLLHVMDAYGVAYSLLVGPNSGYGLDNRCMLDAIAHSAGRFKGIAVVTNQITRAELEALKAEGIVGVAWNVTHYGVDYYADAAGLIDKLEALDLFVQIQVEHDQLVPLIPMLQRSGVRILIDHCGRPSTVDGRRQAPASISRASRHCSGLPRPAVPPSSYPVTSSTRAIRTRIRTFVRTLMR